jgi:DHA1 family inner membrane transport protein
VRSRLLLTVYGLILVAELMWSAMVPIVPDFAHELDLSTFATGVLVSATGAAVLVVSLPAGVLADRLGARRVAVSASFFLAAGLAGHALPPTFAGLFASRLLFGVGFGALWTAGVGLAGELAPPHLRARALALPITIAGVAFMLGPGLAGVVAAQVGPRLPFAVSAAVVFPLAVCLAIGRAPTAEVGPPREPITIGRMRQAARIQVGLASNFVAGFTGNALFLLVPLELAAVGVGSAGIGIALTASAIGFTLTSAGIARIGAAAATAVVAAAATVAMAVPLSFPLVAAGAASLVLLVIVRGPVTAVLYGISYPMCVEGADEAGVGRGTILGLLNMVWAASAVLAPLVCGGIAQVGGNRVVYGLLAAGCLATAPWMLTRRQRIRAVSLSPAA